MQTKVSFLRSIGALALAFIGMLLSVPALNAQFSLGGLMGTMSIGSGMQGMGGGGMLNGAMGRVNNMMNNMGGGTGGMGNQMGGMGNQMGGMGGISSGMPISSGSYMAKGEAGSRKRAEQRIADGLVPGLRMMFAMSSAGQSAASGVVAGRRGDQQVVSPRQSMRAATKPAVTAAGTQRLMLRGGRARP